MPHDLITSATIKSAALIVREITPEEKIRATRNVCGARACRGKEDAELILKALGLIPDDVEGGKDGRRRE